MHDNKYDRINTIASKEAERRSVADRVAELAPQDFERRVLCVQRVDAHADSEKDGGGFHFTILRMMRF